MPFVISCRLQKRVKVTMITILKYLESRIVAEQLKIVLNKQKKIFELRIFSHALNIFHLYLIHFYTHGTSSMETPSPRHINPLAH